MKVSSFFANRASDFVLENLSTFEIAPPSSSKISTLVPLMMMAFMLVMMMMIIMILILKTCILDWDLTLHS